MISMVPLAFICPSMIVPSSKNVSLPREYLQKKFMKYIKQKKEIEIFTLVCTRHFQDIHFLLF